jgi:nucleoside-diphosphate-sugar epimerase
VARILVLGGTRFVGRQVVAALSTRHDLTIVSRRSAGVAGVRELRAERAAGLAALRGQRFDRVLDFIAYDQTGVEDAAMLGDSYLAVSSTWLPRLNGAAANAVVPEDDSRAPSTMLQVTRNYLKGKARLEGELQRIAGKGRIVAALRLPILMGDGDHTGRLDFYRRRIADGNGVLLVDGGQNLVQVLWSGDAVRIISRLVDVEPPRTGAILEALPDAGRPVKQLLGLIAAAMGRSLLPVSAEREAVSAAIDTYLDAEPLWREAPLAITEDNAFRKLSMAATSTESWLAAIPFVEPAAGFRLPREVEFIRGLA